MPKAKARATTAAKKDRYSRLNILEEKARADPYRLLGEIFFTESHKISQDKVLVLKLHSVFLYRAVEDLGLVLKDVEDPESKPGPMRLQWTLIGMKRAAVLAKYDDIVAQTIAARELRKSKRWEEAKTEHDEFVKGSAEGSGWDVRGSWRIRCPEIEEYWGIEELTLEIEVEERDGMVQLWGVFDFGIMEGIMRFEWPGVSGPGLWKRKWHIDDETDEDDDDDDDDHDDDDDDGDGDGDDGAEQLYDSKKRKADNNDGEGLEDDTSEKKAGYKSEDPSLPSPLREPSDLIPSQPTPSCPTWGYRWRGIETVEDEFQCWSDEALCSMTFSEPRGTVLKGILKGEFLILDECSFKGVKVSSQITDRFSPRVQWEAYGMADH